MHAIALMTLLNLAAASDGARGPAPATPAAISLAVADPAAAAVATDVAVATVGTQLRLYAERARATRMSVITTSVVTGAALLSTGIVLQRRSDEVSKSVGVGMIAGGAAPLLFSALLLAPSGIERLSASFDAGATLGAPDGDVLRGTEQGWLRTATDGRRKRIIAGSVETALGGVLSAAGMYLLLARSGVLGLSRNGQYEVGSFLIGPGIPIFSLGVRSLFVESLEETSWRLRAATTEPARAQGSAVTVGVAPVPRGLTSALVLRW